MNALFALALLLIAGLAATRLPRVTPRQPYLRLLLAGGTPLLVLGALLGPGSGVLGDGVLSALAPALALAIGWTGAAFGARLQWRLLRRIPRSFWNRSAVHAATAFAAVAVGAALLALAVPQLRAAWSPLVPAVLALAAIAAVAGPAAVERAARSGGGRPSDARTLGTAATLDTALGTLAFMLALAIDHPRGGPLGGPLSTAAWLLLTVGSGVLVGALFLGLARLREPRNVSVSLLGILIFGAGVGYAARLSPFVVCAIAAVVLANFSPERRPVIERIQTWEPRIYAVLLVMAGAMLGLRTLWLVPAALVLAAVRIAARWAAERYGRRLAGPGRVPADAGLAGIAPGGVALALGLDFLLTYRGTGAPAPGAVLATVVLGVMLVQLAAPVFMIRVSNPPELTASPAPAEVS